MKEGHKIRPEWVPEAYREDKLAITSAQIKAKVPVASLLYSCKKNSFKKTHKQ